MQNNLKVSRAPINENIGEAKFKAQDVKNHGATKKRVPFNNINNGTVKINVKKEPIIKNDPVPQKPPVLAPMNKTETKVKRPPVLVPKSKNTKALVDNHEKRKNPNLEMALKLKTTKMPNKETNIKEKATVGKSVSVHNQQKSNSTELTSPNPKLESQSIKSNSNEVKQEVEEAAVILIENGSDEIKLIEIHNIDAIEETDLFLVPEYSKDIYAHLRDLEVKYPIYEEYLNEHVEIKPVMRTILIDWVHEVAVQFHLLIETFQLTVSIIDRYTQVNSKLTKSNFQLLGVTALFIATKFEELHAPDPIDLAFITDNAYTASEILHMEKHIIQVLDFNVNHPIPIQFLRRFSRAVFATEIHHQAAKYISELSMLNYYLAHHKSSQIAAASLFLVLYLIDDDIDVMEIENAWTPIVQFYSEYSSDDLLHLVKQLAKLLSRAPNTKYNSIYKKYSTAKFDCVALMPQLNTSTSIKLKQLIEKNHN